eukprot:11790010-Ditylum_brightwellii.AAC.2
MGCQCSEMCRTVRTASEGQPWKVEQKCSSKSQTRSKKEGRGKGMGHGRRCRTKKRFQLGSKWGMGGHGDRDLDWIQTWQKHRLT